MSVLANLLDNAARHHRGSGPIEVEASWRADGVHIEIRDSGPGLSTDEADRVFERFYRADHDRSKAAGGAGLGLSIARGIVELHGGVIRAEANHPHGLRMIIEL